MPPRLGPLVKIRGRTWSLSIRLRVFDFDRAIHDALAVYYFPGMWEWNREIVLPLAIDGFLKSMQKQRDRYACASDSYPPNRSRIGLVTLSLARNC